MSFFRPPFIRPRRSQGPLATLSKIASIVLAAETAAYVINGTAASLERGYEVAAAGGSYSINGTAASLERGYEVAAAGGSYSINGTAAALIVTGEGPVLAADSGSYAINGAAAFLERGYEVAADSTSYTINGEEAALVRAVAAAEVTPVPVSSGDVRLVFVTLTHPDLNPPIRVVSEGNNGVSFWNGVPVNYRHNGHLFLGCPFSFDLVTDGEQPPKGRFAIFDADRRVGLMFLSIVDAAEIEVEICNAGDWTDAIDDDNARSPINTPALVYRAKHLRLQNVGGDTVVVQGEVGSYDPRSEPYPKYRATQTLLPGLYRR